MPLESIESPISRTKADSVPFVAFTAMDARAVDDADLKTFCSALLEHGCAYLCTWGPDCERVHDAMDRCVVDNDPPNSSRGTVMTTWHDQESLEEALDFFLSCTLPDESFAPHGCNRAIAIAIGSSEWVNAIREHVRSQTKETPN